MTTEEKAKAYDEALEKAKKYHEEYWQVDAKDITETLFPQLRESEDERIRTEIISALEFANDGGIYDKHIAYLEKQKDDKDELVYRLNGLMQDYIKEGKDDEEKEHRYKCYQLFWDALEDANFFEQKEQKPKMTPKWLYRLEFRDSSCGLWYDGYGKWCFESGIGSISGCKTKTLPMDYDARYKQDGRDWFSSCSRKEDLMHWYSLEDAKELISKGFVFTRYLATEYHEYEQQTVFIKETALYREEIDIFELLGQKPEEWSEEDERMLSRCEKSIESSKQFADSDTFKKAKDNEIDWLENRFKSLRPSWKPSVEQMKALEQAKISAVAGNYITKDGLCSLYEQLKKLM